MSPHVVPKASLVGSAAVSADEEKTAVDSSFEDEQSTIDQAEMADKVRRALAEKRRLGTANAGAAAPTIPPVPTTNAAAITSSAPIIQAPPSLAMPSIQPSPSIPSSLAPSPLSIPTPTFTSPAPPHVGAHLASTTPPSLAPSPLSIPTPTTSPNPLLAPLMRSGASSGALSVGATTGNTATGGHPLEEPTVEDRKRPNLDVLGAARLVIEAGPDAGKDYQLRSGKPILVGRALDNHVVLTDLSVSRKHFEISWEGTHWLLSDRGSGNGTLLNGKLEEGSFRLFNGDRVEIGHTTFLFEQHGQAGRNQWGEEEEPSTIAGRRSTAVPGRPSAVRTTEYEVAPAESAAIPMVERKPLPLPRPGAASPLAAQFLAPASLGAVPVPHGEKRFPTASITRPPKSPPNGSFPQNQNLTGLGNGLPNGGMVNGLGNGMASNPALPLGAPPRSSPMNTLPGRPPIVGPTAPPVMGDGLVPPRHVSPEMVPLMQTMPPRLLNSRSVPVGGGIGHASPGSPKQRPAARPMAVPELAVDSGIAVSPDPRFQNRDGRHGGGAVALEEDVPRLTGRAKAAVALVAGAIVIVAVIALAISPGGDSLQTTATVPDPAVDPNATISVEPTKTVEPSSGSNAGANAGSDAVEPSPNAAPSSPPQKTAAELEADKAADKAAADKLAADKAAADKLAAERAERAEQEAAKREAVKQAAADKAEQEAARREAAKQEAAEKAKAARQAAADKAAKTAKTAKTAPAVTATRVAVAEPAGELDTESVLGKAEDLYRKKNFSGAAQAIRDALRGRSGYEDLRSTAQIYESLHRTYSAGTAVGAKPTDAYTNLRSASRYDDKLGKAHAEDIGPRVTMLAPRAAAHFIASKQYEEAFQALRDAERAGASSSTLNSVRTAVGAHANDLFNQAQAQRESEPSAARALFKKVLKLVEPGSSLHSRATTAFNELK